MYSHVWLRKSTYGIYATGVKHSVVRLGGFVVFDGISGVTSLLVYMCQLCLKLVYGSVAAIIVIIFVKTYLLRF